jgi:hypothetical protein
MTAHPLWNYPPYPFVQQILNHCPKAGSTYFFLWEKKDQNNFVVVSKEDISYFMHFNAFKDNLRKLNLEGLISYVERPGKISVELVNWEDFEE